MSYSDIVAMVEDWDLRLRLIAAAAQEQSDDPAKFVDAQVFRICAQPQWDAAWASALVAHADDTDYEPGKDPAVITDGMILSGMQAVITALSTLATADAQARSDAQAAAAQAEDDRQFAAYTRQREWDMANMPTPSPPADPPDGDTETPPEQKGAA